MRIWIDNSGLQSAAQCLDGRASRSHDYHVRGLLQFATLLIFSDRLSLNGFEDPGIAARSAEIIQQLEGLGITKDIVSVSPVTEAEYALGCQTAADSVADVLVGSFNPNEHLLVAGEPPDLPRGLRERQVAAVSLCSEPDESAKLHRIRKTALKDKAIGAVEYMLASSQPLREAVKRAVGFHTQWGDEQSYQLNIFLRYHLNAALAEQAFSKYAPAVARAELIQRDSQYLVEALQELVDHVAQELRGGSLGVPSTLVALIQRSKGEPRALLKVAMEFRQHSGPLRRALGLLATKYADDTPEGRFEIHKTIAELGHQLKRDVGLEKSTKLGDAVEFRLILGVTPTLSLSGRELMKWYAERRRRKQTAVLTELVKASAYSDLSTDLYGKLRTASTRRT